jgi:hypothetical protein
VNGLWYWVELVVETTLDPREGTDRMTRPAAVVLAAETLLVRIVVLNPIDSILSSEEVTTSAPTSPALVPEGGPFGTVSWFVLVVLVVVMVLFCCQCRWPRMKVLLMLLYLVESSVG